MRLNKSALAVSALLGLCATQAHAQLVITPTYADNIKNDSNAATIEASIQSVINVYETKFTNNVTANITFQEGGGLGTSSTFYDDVSYTDYVAALRSHEVGQGFLTYVPNTNPLNNGVVHATDVDLRALGFTDAQFNNVTDSTITLNTAIMNLSRTGSQDPNNYDLQAVASHEIDEVLGLGSVLDNLANGAAAPTNRIGTLDLFRYSGNGVRSFDTNKSTASYLSADGGKNYIVYFNQTAGGDFHDWYSNNGADGAGNSANNPNAVLGPPQVQDAFGSPGTQENLGSSEFTALQMVGYTLAAAPEPSQFAALGLGILGLGGVTLRARRRNTSV